LRLQPLPKTEKNLAVKLEIAPDEIERCLQGATDAETRMVRSLAQNMTKLMRDNPTQRASEGLIAVAGAERG
jgi:hypothetical protein